MTIKKNIYQEIMTHCSNKQTETGGIIGGENGVISEFIFDLGLDEKESGCYYPNTEVMNRYLSEWQQRGITFYGIVHSHLQEKEDLSSGDKEYISSIIQAMPHDTNRLYFPLILPLYKMISFTAEKIDGIVKIVSDKINLV